MSIVEVDSTGLFQMLQAKDAVSFMDARCLTDVSDDLNSVTAALLVRLVPGDRLFVTELAPETRWTGSGLKDDVEAWLRARMTTEAAPPGPVKVAAKASGRGPRGARPKAS